VAERPEIVAMSELAAGTMVGEYRVTHKLGEGGMGVVYAGIHPEIGKRVAIKILGPQAAAHPDLIRRFKEEARAVNKIRHPNIIDIFAFNQLADGRHYFVMEYLDGESLTDRLARGPMDFGEMRRLLAQICSALHAAHEAGVVHRDLKPDNIWVATPPLSESRIKLLDFGIAKLNDISTAHSTQSGVPMGTPLYMAPEQAMGRAIDRRVDIYALGVLLYQVFAGTLPFHGATPHEVVLKHVTEPALPPSRHREIRPQGMEEIILACLEKDPQARPESAASLAARIEAVFAASASTPAHAGVAMTVPRLSAPAVPPSGGAPPKGAERDGVGGTSLSGFTGDSVVSTKPRTARRTGLIIAGVVLSGAVAVTAFVARRPPEPPPAAAVQPPAKAVVEQPASQPVAPIKVAATPDAGAAPAPTAKVSDVPTPKPAPPPPRSTRRKSSVPSAPPNESKPTKANTPMPIEVE
jgi:serine/threonine-protein kinase